MTFIDAAAMSSAVIHLHPSKDGTDEDDGVLLSVVFDPAQGKDGLSFVIILDAKDFKEIARLQLGCKIQAHYHGKFCKHYGDRTCVGH